MKTEPNPKIQRIIQYEISPGMTITPSILTAIEIANREQCRVTASHNGRDFFADPGDTVEVVGERYDAKNQDVHQAQIKTKLEQEAAAHKLMILSVATECCWNCRHWERGRIDEGECRKKSPVIVPEYSLQASVFPITRANIRCDDYSRDVNRDPIPYEFMTK